LIERDSLNPLEGAARPARQRLDIKGELTLALLPTLTVLLVFFFVETFSRQRLLFASLASSAFLIDLDPQHGTNRARTLVLSQIPAALLGYAANAVGGPGYVAAGCAMILTIVLMIVLDTVHPPAVATALGFALKAGPESNVLLFSLAVGMIAVLVVLQRASLWLLVRYTSTSTKRAPPAM